MGSKLSIITTLFLVSLSVFAIAKENVPHKDRNIAKKIAKEKGVLKPTEVQKWDPPKDIPKDWIKLDNDFFSVYYPKCYNVEAIGEEGNTKTALLLTFKRNENCPEFIKGFGDSNWFVFGYRWELKSITNSSYADYIVFSQNIIVNEHEGKIFAGIHSAYELLEETYKVELRWQVHISCKNKIFTFVTSVPSGEASLNLINKSEYAIADDYKKILSTFECKNKKIDLKK